MMRKLLGCLLVTLLFVSPASALDLDSAKAQGLVGETQNGYLAPVSAPNGEVQKLVERINNERKQRYASIAKQNKTPVAAVEALAGKKAVEMTPGGQFVQDAQGQWVRK